MARLAESTVQQKALNFLYDYYQLKAKGKVYHKIEVRTRKEFGGKRADGFLAFKRWFRGIYVISMESKSYKTLPAMKPYRDNKKWFWNSVWFAFVFCIGTGGLYAIYKMDNTLWSILYPALAFLTGFIVYGLFTKNSFKHQSVDVINQLDTYPGNEQWLSFSKDSINGLKERKWDNLKKICKSQGYGIILVGQRGAIEVVNRPRVRRKFSGDYLKFYALEKEIRAFLN